MFNFPEWVEKPKRQSKQQLAEKRLRYMMCSLALERGGRGSVASFAAAIGLERATVNNYLKEGKLSAPAAASAEQYFGREMIHAEWLTDPLSIEVD